MGKYDDLLRFADGADEEYKAFLLEYVRTDGRMDERTEEKAAISKKVSSRQRLTNLGEIRETRHLTQADLARKVSTNRRCIGQIENGRQAPSVFLALALAEALEVKIEELFYLGPIDEPPTSFDKSTAMVVSTGWQAPDF